MPRKAWCKRMVYEKARASRRRLDWKAHRQLFRKWAAQRDRRPPPVDARSLPPGWPALRAGKASCRRFHHHDTHAANAFYASGFDAGPAGHARRLRLRAAAAASTSAARQGITAAAPLRLPQLAGHLLRARHQRPGLQAEPARGQDRRPGRLRQPQAPAPTSCSTASTCADGDIRIAGGHEPLLHPRPGRPLRQARRRRRLPARAGGSRPPGRRLLGRRRPG